MGRIFYLLFSLCYLVVTINGFVSPQAYWDSKLPNTSIPQHIKDSLVTPGGDHVLQPSIARKFLGSTKDQFDLKSIIEAYIGTHGDRRSLSSSIDSKGKTTNLKEHTVSPNPLFLYSSDKLHEGEESTLKEQLVSSIPLFLYSTDKLSEGKTTNLKEHTVSPNPLFLYSSKQLESKVSMHKDVANSEEGQLVFVEEDLHIGKTLKLHFKKGTKNNPFLPRDVSNKIPFSSKHLQDTLNLLSINPKSTEAESVSKKMSLCEEPAIEGLQKQCVTSLESMLDFVVSSLGTNVEPLIIEVERDFPKMEYKIESVKRLTKNDHETVVCHKMDYPYALYFCHGTLTLRPYMVSLVGEDGTKIQAVASCHKETSDVMKTFMKDVLKVMPGTTRICHIPPAEDNIFWVTKSM